jgi:TRAP-type uncharacterized transport system fused permease subunit
MHVGDLDKSTVKRNQNWDCTVTITVHDQAHKLLAGVVITGSWSDGSSSATSCTTNSSGKCSLTRSRVSNSVTSLTFTITEMTKSGYTYNSSDNHDPESDSNGTSIVINKP